MFGEFLEVLAKTKGLIFIDMNNCCWANFQGLVQPLFLGSSQFHLDVG